MERHLTRWVKKQANYFFYHNKRLQGRKVVWVSDRKHWKMLGPKVEYECQYSNRKHCSREIFPVLKLFMYHQQPTLFMHCTHRANNEIVCTQEVAILEDPRALSFVMDNMSCVTTTPLPCPEYTALYELVVQRAMRDGLRNSSNDNLVLEWNFIWQMWIVAHWNHDDSCNEDGVMTYKCKSGKDHVVDGDCYPSFGLRRQPTEDSRHIDLCMYCWDTKSVEEKKPLCTNLIGYVPSTMFDYCEKHGFFQPRPRKRRHIVIDEEKGEEPEEKEQIALEAPNEPTETLKRRVEILQNVIREQAKLLQELRGKSGQLFKENQELREQLDARGLQRQAAIAELREGEHILRQQVLGRLQILENAE